MPFKKRKKQNLGNFKKKDLVLNRDVYRIIGGRPITSNLLSMKQIFLKKNEIANAYLLSSKYRYDFDSSITTFTFYYVKDSSEIVINIDNGAKNHH